jgi:hypothetical protein
MAMSKIIFLCLITLSFILFTKISHAQKWQPGYFYDIKGNKETGFIWLHPSGKPAISEEAFIEFRENNKENPFKLSASDLKSFVVGRDSFTVASAPRTSDWKNELDFVKVTLDVDELKLYFFNGNGGGGSGFHPELGVGAGTGIGGGSGGFGGGVGAGFSVPIGGSGGGKGSKIEYYYGANTAEMKRLTPANFVDVMSEIMGDEPDVVDQLHQNKFNLGNIDKLIAYFHKVQASHSSQ